MLVKSHRGWVVLVLGLGLGMGQWAQTRPLTVEDLVGFNRISQPVVSPDGQTLVYNVRETVLAANKAHTGLYALQLSSPTSSASRITPSTLNPQDPHFSPDGQALYFLSTHNDVTQLFRANHSNKTATFDTPTVVSALPVDIDAYWLSPDSHHVLLSIAVYPDCETLACTAERLKKTAEHPTQGQVYTQLFVRHWDQYSDGRRSQLFVGTLDDNGKLAGAVSRLTHIDGDIPSKPFGGESEVSFSKDGNTVYFNVRVAGKSEPWSTNFDIYSINLDGHNLKNLTESNLAWDADPLPSADGQTLYYRAMSVAGAEADRFRVMSLDLKTGSRKEVAPNFDRSVGALQWSADGKNLLTTVDDHGTHLLYLINPKNGSAKALTERGHVSEFVPTRNGMIIALDSLTHPTDLYRLDGKGSVTALTHVNEDKLAAIEFSQPEVFSFKGYNNEPVQGTVFKPVGYKPGQSYPVAFLIHGGPQGSWMDSFSYRWNPQTYAGLGYAVVTIDFHGSTGYGQAFTDSISEHWGDRPLEDLQKGWAQALSQYPFLDGKRACALGASYGGFMINWIAGHWHTPSSGAWRCLVNHDGVFDTRAMYYTTEELWFAEHENGGTPWTRPDAFEKFNPAAAVGEWRIPMLVVQGARDYRVPIGQGISAFTALQRRGIESELLLFPTENHWVLSPQNSIQWHHSVEAWLKRWLPQ
jgi:dipeptidyl aminopeptidase/acylaminoacyl peptidase